MYEMRTEKVLLQEVTDRTTLNAMRKVKHNAQVLLGRRHYLVEYLGRNLALVILTNFDSGAR